MLIFTAELMMRLEATGENQAPSLDDPHTADVANLEQDYRAVWCGHGDLLLLEILLGPTTSHLLPGPPGA